MAMVLLMFKISSNVQKLYDPKIMFARILRTSYCHFGPIRLITGRRMASGKFTVRRLATAEEVRENMSKRVPRPGALDHVSFFAADERGFFVGELDGKPISCLSIVRYADNYAVGGHYRVDKPYQGKGYGLQTCMNAIAMANIDEGCNWGGDAMEVMEQIYRKFSIPANRVWNDQRVDFVASQASFNLSGISLPPSVKIQPVYQVEFQDLVEYDTSVNVFPRASFLEKWVFAPNCWAFAATNDNGEIVGYAVVRTTLKQEEGWIIGPVFADSSLIARNLYRALFDRVAAEDPSGIVTVDVPYGDMVNPEAFQIVKDISGTPSVKYVRMYSKGVPSGMPLKKIFGITSIQLG